MLTKHAYQIQIEDGCLNEGLVANILILVSAASTFAILSDDIVKPLYADRLHSYFVKSGLKSFQFSFKNGEENKTRATKEHIEDQMLENNLGSDTCLIAIGGGVTTDLAGYIAATYCRGIPLILIPTTLLAMCDAAIGGKNGVNTALGKNLIGTILQPKKVIIDPLTLKTLSSNELKTSFSEVIKHAIIADGSFFDYLENVCDPMASIEKIIATSCRIKTEIVNDAKKNKRHLLNFGHTVAHAVEIVSEYRISHGEAVAIGMVIESKIAVILGKLKESAFDRIKKIILQFRLNCDLPADVSIEKLLEAMILDKKSLNGKPRFVILKGIGSCDNCDDEYCTTVDEDLVREALKEGGIGDSSLTSA